MTAPWSTQQEGRVTDDEMVAIAKFRAEHAEHQAHDPVVPCPSYEKPWECESAQLVAILDHIDRVMQSGIVVYYPDLWIEARERAILGSSALIAVGNTS